jgi:hypothetical protein
MTYRITLLPRAIGPFAEKEDLLSPDLPRFEGSFVVVSYPIDVEDPVEGPAPVLFAWPVEALAGVQVMLVDDERPES